MLYQEMWLDQHWGVGGSCMCFSGVCTQDHLEPLWAFMLPPFMLTDAEMISQNSSLRSAPLNDLIHNDEAHKFRGMWGTFLTCRWLWEHAAVSRWGPLSSGQVILWLLCSVCSAKSWASLLGFGKFKIRSKSPFLITGFWLAGWHSAQLGWDGEKPKAALSSNSRCKFCSYSGIRQE